MNRPGSVKQNQCAVGHGIFMSEFTESNWLSLPFCILEMH